MTPSPQLIAAHYIGLLLLSTAAPGSHEHSEIVRLNGPGVWLALEELDLVERSDDGPDDGALWVLTERGQVLVEHVLALPLPERVRAWRMPHLPGSPTPTPRAAASRLSAEPSAEGPGGATPASGRDASRRRSRKRTNLQPASADSSPPSVTDDDGLPPPRPPAPKPIPHIVPHPDPELRMRQAGQLLERGYGLTEVAETLEMDAGEIDRRFYPAGP